MRTFEHFSKGNHICPICGTDDDKETMLIGIIGTEEGKNIQAAQVHTQCLQEGMMLYPNPNIGEMGMIICFLNHDWKRELTDNMKEEEIIEDVREDEQSWEDMVNDIGGEG